MAIATALAATRAMPFVEAGQSALRKLTSVMAAAPKDTASRLVSHIRVIQGPGGAISPDIERIQRALLDGVAVELTYTDSQARETVRTVEPHGLVGTRSGWYLVAWCRLRQAPRAFRLDRIAGTCLTAERITPRSLDAMLPDFPFDVAEPALVTGAISTK